MPRLPDWIRRPLETDREFSHVHKQIKKQALHTVCESARCPNRHECWNAGTATIMILGEVCTRSCRFCAVKSGRPPILDTEEAGRVAEACKGMDLKHVVLTSVNRDELPDGGAGIWAETILEIRNVLPSCTIEVLTPDFMGNTNSMDTVLEARPDIFSHNLETVKRFQPVIRPQASYGVSLATLKYASQHPTNPAIKTGIMLGFGETREELLEAMEDLLQAGVEILTLGQYLRPTSKHAEVIRYIPPDEFDALGQVAREKGFKAVASGPFVRSSYKAEELFASARGSFEVV